MKDWLEYLNQFSPNRCRATAKTQDGRRLASHVALSIRSGLSVEVITRMSHSRTWDDFTARQINAFTRACGIDLRQPKTSFYRKLRHSKQYINTATPNQRRMLMKLLK